MKDQDVVRKFQERRSDFKLMRDIKVILGEEVVTQHRMLVSDMNGNSQNKTENHLHLSFLRGS